MHLIILTCLIHHHMKYFLFILHYHCQRNCESHSSIWLDKPWPTVITFLKIFLLLFFPPLFVESSNKIIKPFKLSSKSDITPPKSYVLIIHKLDFLKFLNYFKFNLLLEILLKNKHLICKFESGFEITKKFYLFFI